MTKEILRKNIDYAGGLIIGGSTNVFVNGVGVVRIGDQVSPHGRDIHSSSVMAQGSSSVFVNGISVCRVGDLATCGHPGTLGSAANIYSG
jgi:uncharacterized Zn-binding protein involved in type VI secretion